MNKCPYQLACENYDTTECPEHPLDCDRFKSYAPQNAVEIRMEDYGGLVHRILVKGDFVR